MSLFYYHLLGLNNRYTLRENGRLVTYSYVHSLVITKIRKITNFENVFNGLLRDTLRDRIDPSSWRFEFLPFRYERDERAEIQSVSSHASATTITLSAFAYSTACALPTNISRLNRTRFVMIGSNMISTLILNLNVMP